MVVITVPRTQLIAAGKNNAATKTNFSQRIVLFEADLICNDHSQVVSVCKAPKQSRNAEQHASTVHIS